MLSEDKVRNMLNNREGRLSKLLEKSGRPGFPDFSWDKVFETSRDIELLKKVLEIKEIDMGAYIVEDYGEGREVRFSAHRKGISSVKGFGNSPEEAIENLNKKHRAVK